MAIINTNIRPTRGLQTAGQAQMIEQDLANISTGVAQGFQTAINIRKQQVAEVDAVLDNLEKLKQEGDIAHRSAISDKINEIYDNVSNGIYKSRKSGKGNKFVGIGAQKLDSRDGMVTIDEYIRAQTQKIGMANTRSQAMKESYDQSVREIKEDPTIPASRKIEAIQQIDEQFKSPSFLFNDVDGQTPDDPNAAFQKVLDSYRDPETARKLVSKEFIDGIKQTSGYSELKVRRRDGTQVAVSYSPDIHEIIQDENGNTIGVDVKDEALDDFIVDQMETNPLALRDILEDFPADQQIVLDALEGRKAVKGLEDIEDGFLEAARDKFRTYLSTNISQSRDDISADELELKKREAQRKANEQNKPDEMVSAWDESTQIVASGLGRSLDEGKPIDANAVAEFNARDDSGGQIIYKGNFDNYRQELADDLEIIENAIAENKTVTTEEIGGGQGGSYILESTDQKGNIDLSKAKSLIENQQRNLLDKELFDENGVMYIEPDGAIRRIKDSEDVKSLWYNISRAQGGTAMKNKIGGKFAEQSWTKGFGEPIAKTEKPSNDYSKYNK